MEKAGEKAGDQLGEGAILGCHISVHPNTKPSGSQVVRQLMDRDVLGSDIAKASNLQSMLSKEVWKILPSYEELRRGAIGRGKEVEVVSIRCHVN